MCGRRSSSPESEDHQPRARKRQRVRLSCLECRRRKLSCDRGFPCERCIKSGTPDRCSYESRSGEVVHASSTLLAPDRDDDHRLRRLELEIAQLKSQLGRPYDGSTLGGTHSPQPDEDETMEVQECIEAVNLSGEKGELRFFRGKGFRTRYFGPHNASMAFVELNGLCPFMKETADEWLRPVVLHDGKDRKRRKEEREEAFAQPDVGLDALLPNQLETDALVSVYLDQFEQMHRIVHIPTFSADYAGFWKADGKQRPASLTALVLSMMAVASCVHTCDKLALKARHCARGWIEACDGWLARQSQKHRKLVHFQIACLLYLGKRVNTIKKKRFWTGAGALVQDGIAVGLHREPSHMGGKISVYHQEMRRRIWATIQELDMQASFDHGLPTLLSQLHYDTHPPRNLEDDAFDEQTTELPPSRAQDEYTFASFQNLARQSLPLRLELSRLLTGPLSDLDYEQVMLLTNSLTREIDGLPSWDVKTDKAKGRGNPLMAYTLLHIQLRQYMIPLHQPYLKLRRQDSRCQYSEMVYYNAARDMILLHDKLHEQGVRALSFLREDALTTAINLCSVTMLQPRGSTNMIMINSRHTLKLMEKCIAIKEDRLLRCGNSEPWGYSIMCAALGLLETHLGTKTPEAARSTSAERFVKLHQRMLAGQEASGEPVAGEATRTLSAPCAASEAPPDRAKSVTPFVFHPTTMPWAPLDGSTPGSLELGDVTQLFGLDPSLEPLGLNLNELWGESWELG